MSASSELRAALREITPKGKSYSMLIPDEVRDAILDAVIASLPEERDMGEPGSYNVGHNHAIDEVTELLQSAKSANKRSE